MTPLEHHAQQIMKKIGFSSDSTLQFGTWYDANPRSLVYAGHFQGQEAVLKVYNEPHAANQPANLRLFERCHTSQKMLTPNILIEEVESSHAGWFVTEYIPHRATLFQSPLAPEERREFLHCFFEYRAHFPLEPPEGTTHGRDEELIPRKMSSERFHSERIRCWKKLMNVAEQQRRENGDAPFLNNECLALCEKAEKIIADVFSDQPLYWCHGHFKTNEVHMDHATKEFWMTDFAHMNVFPRGYELAFIIWADAFWEWQDSVDVYVHRIREWMRVYKQEVSLYGEKQILSPQVYNALILERSLMHVAMLERILGALYADVVGRQDRDEVEKAALVERLSAALQLTLNNQLMD